MSTMHRVRRWRWQARAPDSGTALSLRRLLREQHDACEAALDRAGAAVIPPGEVWRVPRLELSVRLADLTEIGAGHLAERVEAALRTALADLASVPADPGVGAAETRTPTGPAPQSTDAPPLRRRAGDADARESLRHYLATGLSPWALAGLGSEAGHEALVTAAVGAAGAVVRGDIRLESLLPAGSDARRIGALLRWLVLLPPVVRRVWLAVHAGDAGLPGPIVAEWRRWMDDDAADRLEWQALWLAMPLPRTTLRDRVAVTRAQAATVPPFLDALAEALDAGRTVAPPAPAAPRQDPPAGARADAVRPMPTVPPAVDAAPQSLSVPLAGLVLLHPWLPRLLGACGVLDAGGRQIEPAARPKALALLHALACGEAEPYEHELPFAKLLLGGRPDEPLDVPLPRPGAGDRAEIDALLAAVREHWSALRGTGVEGLRLSFLQRRGLLARADSGWRLRMEAEPFDLLLATLPWSVGLVRLPWMDRPLTVEWPVP